jgi:hypothetical protein
MSNGTGGGYGAPGSMGGSMPSMPDIAGGGGGTTSALGDQSGGSVGRGGMPPGMPGGVADSGGSHIPGSGMGMGMGGMGSSGGFEPPGMNPPNIQPPSIQPPNIQPPSWGRMQNDVLVCENCGAEFSETSSLREGDECPNCSGGSSFSGRSMRGIVKLGIAAIMLAAAGASAVWRKMSG